MAGGEEQEEGELEEVEEEEEGPIQRHETHPGPVHPVVEEELVVSERP